MPWHQASDNSARRLPAAWHGPVIPALSDSTSRFRPYSLHFDLRQFRQHGGFGKPHLLGVATLLVLLVAAVAGHSKLPGRASPYVETLAYSTTFFFHMIPGITETATRLPLGAPWLPHAEAHE